MTDLRKAAEMALEVLEADEAYIMCAGGNGDHQREAAKALRQALAMENFSEVNQEIEEALRQAPAQPEQEPVVHPVVHLWDCICNWAEMIANDGKNANLSPPDWLVDAVKLATAPPKREWVGLTDEEIGWLWHNSPPNSHEYARAIEAKLKEKNT